MKSKVEDELLKSSSEESESEDDEDGWKLTEEVEKEFYKTLSQIKNKDPNIYKKDVEFFKNTPIPENSVTKKKKSNPLTLQEYECKIVTEKRGEFSDEEDSLTYLKKQKEPTYVEEQEELKKSFKTLESSGSEDDNDDLWGSVFKKREKTEEDKLGQCNEEEDKYFKEWLKGQKDNVSDEEVEKQMKPLRDYWTNPNLDEDDQFLRDYVLNKKFLDNDGAEENIETLLEDPKEKGNDVKFSHVFEEPDQEFVKRYPRVMENSIRRKNDHRKQKREEIKERKIKEKEKKMAEIKRKKKLRKKEIEEELEELKTVTGNDKVDFQNMLGKDFDLDEYDMAMKRLFDEEFYSQDDPNFHPDGSKNHDEMQNEENYEEEEPVENVVEEDEYLNCEDPNFNMDCDYDPTQEKPKEKTSRSRRRKDKHRRTTVSEAVNKEKPTFDPTTHDSFQKYLDEYYSIDCEDFIGDLPCRFKYRRTVPNSYGLTIEEILAADEKELNRWCSLKRIQQRRTEDKERGDVKVFRKKGEDERLKRKILPSLFQKNTDEEKINQEDDKSALKNKNKNYKNNQKSGDASSHGSEIEDKQEHKKSESHLKSKKKKKKQKVSFPDKQTRKENDVSNTNKRKLENSEEIHKNKIMKMSKNNDCKKWSVKDSKHVKYGKNMTNKSAKVSKKSVEDSSLTTLSDARLLAYGIKPKKFRNRLKYRQPTTR